MDGYLLVLGDLDDAVADRLGAAVRMDEAPGGHAGVGLRHGVGLDHPDPRRRLERGEIFGRFPDLGIADDLEHRDHRTAVLAVAGLPVVHRANEVVDRQAGHVGGFVVAGAGRQMAGAAGAHLRVLVAVLDDLRHLRMHLRTPDRNVVEIVDGGAGVRHAIDRPHAVGRKARFDLHLVGDGKRPVRLLLLRRRQRRDKHDRQNADDPLHERNLPPFSGTLRGGGRLCDGRL